MAGKRNKKLSSHLRKAERAAIPEQADVCQQAVITRPTVQDRLYKKASAPNWILHITSSVVFTFKSIKYWIQPVRWAEYLPHVLKTKTLHFQKNYRGPDLGVLGGRGWKADFLNTRSHLFPSASNLTSEVRLSTEFSSLQRLSAKHHIHKLQDTRSPPALEQTAPQLTLTFDFSVEGANRKYCYQYMQKSGISSSACMYGRLSVSQRC